MRIEVFPLDFMADPTGAMTEPRDRQLHDLAVSYCRQNLEQDPNLAKFAKVWVAVAVDEQGKYLEVTGLTGYVMKPDIPMFRVTGNNAARSTKMLTERLHAFFADNGARGHEVFIHISGSETPEQRCPRWEESLSATKAKPADRFSIIVK